MSGRRALTQSVVLLLAMLVATSRLSGQAAVDVIRGTIRSTANVPIANVTVTIVDSASAIAKQARTDKDGRFTLIFSDGGGDYWVTLAAVGYGARRYELKRNADEAVLVADAKMSAAGTTLATMRTVGTRQRPTRNDSLKDIGGTIQSVDLSSVSLDQAGDLNAMIATLPGLTLTTNDDGSTAGFSIFGLDASQNSILIDGSASSTTNLPRDTPMSVSLASPYDVSQGRFGGAQIVVRTGGGGNYASRSMSSTLDMPPLQWTDSTGRALGQVNTHLSLGGNARGPLSLNRVFYSSSYQFDHTYSGLPSLLTTDPAGLEAAGISADSVQRFLSIVGADGIPGTFGGVPRSSQTDRGSVFGRVDLTSPLSASGQSLSLTFTGGASRTTPNGRAASLATQLPSHGSESETENGSLSAQHTTYFGFGVLSATTVGVNETHFATSPFLDMPSGSVRISSTFDDGTSGIASLTLGGNTALSRTTTTAASAVNALSWFSPENTHTLKVTTELYYDGAATVSDFNQYGSFSFNSLSDFDAGTPAAFTRQLTPRIQDLSQGAFGTSLGDWWRASGDLQFAFGVRVDGNRFLTTPAYDATVDQLFGIRNDRLPDRVYVSPRAGFTWTYGTAPVIGGYVGSARIPRALIRGGVGIFQNVGSSTLVSSQVSNTGLPTATQSIYCVGPAAPTPDWRAYAASTTSIPDECADGTQGTIFASTVPSVSVFDRSYQQPRSLRGNLQWQGPVLGNRFTSTINGTYSANERQQDVVDLNFTPTVRFTLPDEDNRPVYVEPASIIAGTGAIASHDARVSQLFSSVPATRSDLLSTDRQVSVALSPMGYHPTFSWSVTYLNNDNRDEQRGFSANTAGDPLDLQWGRASGDWHHQLSTNFSLTVQNTVTFSWTSSLRSGSPFTPSVSGDINGDGYGGNDRAFIFDPAHTTDPALAAGMQALLTNAPATVRECLTSQLGQVAGRNSCEGPWTITNTTLTVSVPQQRLPLPHRMGVKLQVQNALTGADLLLHGQQNLRGWGQQAYVQPQLLYVRAFDPSTDAFLYTVNPRFGASNPQLNTFFAPAKITLQFNVNIGQPFEQQSFIRQLNAGRVAPGTKASEQSLQSVLSAASAGVDPMVVILRASDSIRLSPANADTLAQLNRWFTNQADSIVFPAARLLVALGDHYDERQAYAIYRDVRERTIDLLISIIPQVDRLLTAEQKRLLPANVARDLDVRYLRLIRSSTISPGG